MHGRGQLKFKGYAQGYEASNLQPPQRKIKTSSSRRKPIHPHTINQAIPLTLLLKLGPQQAPRPPPAVSEGLGW